MFRWEALIKKPVFRSRNYGVKQKQFVSLVPLSLLQLIPEGVHNYKSPAVEVLIVQVMLISVTLT